MCSSAALRRNPVVERADHRLDHLDRLGRLQTKAVSCRAGSKMLDLLTFFPPRLPILEIYQIADIMPFIIYLEIQIDWLWQGKAFMASLESYLGS